MKQPVQWKVRGFFLGSFVFSSSKLFRRNLRPCTSSGGSEKVRQSERLRQEPFAARRRGSTPCFSHRGMGLSGSRTPCTWHEPWPHFHWHLKHKCVIPGHWCFVSFGFQAPWEQTANLWSLVVSMHQRFWYHVELGCLEDCQDLLKCCRLPD